MKINYLTIYKKICAGDLDGTKSICRGDSGGPLYVVDQINGKSKLVLAGISSYVSESGCAFPG